MKKIIIFLVAFFYVTNIQSQVHEDWVNISPLKYPTEVVVDDSIVWVSAYNGIIKYEKSTGKKTYLDRANANLADNSVLCLHLDSSNALWHGGKYYGVGKLTDTECEILTSVNSGLPIDIYNDKIAEDNDGNIWIISWNFVSRFDGTIWKTWSTGSPVSTMFNLSYADIVFDSSNVGYVISPFGLGKIEDDNYISLPGFAEIENQCITIDDFNTLWIGAYFNGLYQYNRDTIIHYTSQNSNFPHSFITDIAFHHETGLWIATYEGLVNYNNDTFTLYPIEGPGPTTLAFDDDGSIWCGTFSSQLVHFKDSVYTYINLANNPLVLRPVSVLLSDTKNIKWITDGIGNLIVISDTTFRVIERKRKPCAAIEDRDGAIWTAFKEGNIHMQKMTEFDTIVFDSTNSPLLAIKLPGSSDPTKKRYINDMVADINNHIWISTRYKGLFEYDGTQFINYTLENSEIPSSSVGELLVDSENNLWGGSNGLFKYDGETWTNWNTENSNIPGNEVLSLSFDTDSVLWISCKEGGLSSFDGLDFTTYDTSNSGILSNTIYEILAEKDSLWLATSGAGLVVFDKKSQWTSYNVSNSGIASNKCNSLKRDKDGFLWIGHSNAGISVYKRDSIITHIENYLDDEHELLIYPNPSNDILYIQSSNGEQISEASIFDHNGRLLLSVPVEQLSTDHTLYQLHLADLKVTGIFVLKVMTTDGKSMSASFFYYR